MSDVGCGISIGAVRRLSIRGNGLGGRSLPLRLGRVTHIAFAATGPLFFSSCRGGGTYNSFVLVSPVAGGADTIKVVVSEIRTGSVLGTVRIPALGLTTVNVNRRRCRTVRGIIGRLSHRNVSIGVRGWRHAVGGEGMVKLLRFGGLPVGALMNTS